MSQTKLKRVYYRERKDPLTDRVQLNCVARKASNAAKQRAFDNGASITVIKDDKYFEIAPDGSKKLIKDASQQHFPSLEEDLCPG